MTIKIEPLPVVNYAQYEPQLDGRSVGLGVVPYGLMAVGLIATARTKGMIGTRMAVVGSGAAALVSIFIAKAYRTSQYNHLKQKIEEGATLHSTLNALFLLVNRVKETEFSESAVTSKQKLNEKISSAKQSILKSIQNVGPSPSKSLQMNIDHLNRLWRGILITFQMMSNYTDDNAAALNTYRKKVVTDLTNFSDQIKKYADSIVDIQERFVGLIEQN